ncbi:hypothetical protein ACFLU6_06765, partial [Acidobacteriota bacterium]
DALTPGVTPALAAIDFPDAQPGLAVPHMGAPLTFAVPDSLACGDPLVFTLALTSAETGTLEPEFFTVRVDGDPSNCLCSGA